MLKLKYERILNYNAGSVGAASIDHSE